MTADDELIERLEVALEQAKRGELVSMFYVKIMPNGNWAPSWAGRKQYRLLMVGILEGLKYELLSQVEEVDE